MSEEYSIPEDSYWDCQTRCRTGTPRGHEVFGLDYVISAHNVYGERQNIVIGTGMSSGYS